MGGFIHLCLHNLWFIKLYALNEINSYSIKTTSPRECNFTLACCTFLEHCCTTNIIFCTTVDFLIYFHRGLLPTRKKNKPRLLSRDKHKQEKIKSAVLVVFHEEAALHIVSRLFMSSQRVSEDLTSPFSVSIKRCSEAIEGRLGDVRLWGFTHCTLCLWVSALFECLRDRDGHFHSRHEINSLQPLRALATGPA